MECDRHALDTAVMLGCHSLSNCAVEDNPMLRRQHHLDKSIVFGRQKIATTTFGSLREELCVDSLTIKLTEGGAPATLPNTQSPLGKRHHGTQGKLQRTQGKLQVTLTLFVTLLSAFLFMTNDRTRAAHGCCRQR